MVMARDELEEVLGNYDANTLKSLARHYADRAEVNKLRKASAIRLLVDVLSKPGRVKGVIAELGDASRDAVVLARRLPEPLVGGVVARLSGMGHRGAVASLKEVMIRGLLLGAPLRHDRVLTVRDLTCQARRPLLVPPGAVKIEATLRPVPLKLPEVPQDQVKEVRRGEPQKLIRALLKLVAFAGKARLKLTKAGWLSATHIPRIQRVVEAGEDTVPAPLVLEVALATGLLQEREGLLRPGAGRADLLGDPLPVTVAKLVGPFSEMGIWPDDQWAGSAADIYRGMQEPPSRGPTSDALRFSRATVLDTVRRLRTRGWVDLERLVDAALKCCPFLGLFPTSGRGGYSAYYYSSYSRRPDGDFSGPSRAWEQAMQRELVRCVVGRTLVAFGLVEVGRTGRRWHQFLRPKGDAAHWNRFADPGGSRWRPRDEKPRPPWKPTPCGVAVRVTDLGRQVLWGEDSLGKDDGEPGLTVNPDFEVAAYRDRASDDVLMKLQTFARPLEGHPDDPVSRFRLEQEPLVEALKAGLSLQAVTETLEAHSGRPLPQNVARTMTDWARRFGTLEIFLDRDLVEFASRAARDRWISRRRGAVAVGRQMALCRRARGKKKEITDYEQAPVRCLRADPDGTLRLSPDLADLLVRDELSGLAAPVEGEADTWRITRASIDRAGHPSKKTLKALKDRCLDNVPDSVALAISGWCGEVKPLGCEALPLLAVDEEERLAGLMEHPDLKPHIRGLLPPRYLVVKKGRMKAARKALAGLGLEVNDGVALEHQTPSTSSELILDSDFNLAKMLSRHRRRRRWR